MNTATATINVITPRHRQEASILTTVQAVEERHAEARIDLAQLNVEKQMQAMRDAENRPQYQSALISRDLAVKEVKRLEQELVDMWDKHSQQRTEIQQLFPF